MGPPLQRSLARSGPAIIAGLQLLLTPATAALAAAEQVRSGDDSRPHASAEQQDGQNGREPVLIRGKPWLFNSDTRYAHSLPEVDGTTITVTSKTALCSRINALPQSCADRQIVDGSCMNEANAHSKFMTYMVPTSVLTHSSKRQSGTRHVPRAPRCAN